MNTHARKSRWLAAFLLALPVGAGAATRIEVLPPAESLKRFQVDPSLEMELVAAEPDVAQPVCLNFDERGRMWVVQYLQYPFPAGLKVVGHDEYWRVKYDAFPPAAPPHHVKGADKVTIFEDKDGDGVFESHKDFVTGLNITTSALPGQGGIWVMNPPYLLFYPDANHDDIPDGDPVAHLAGFGLEDMHAVANSLTWGPDGWLYGCQGSTCTATVTRPGIDEPGVRMSGQFIWRYHPASRKFEIFAEGGYNNFGIAVDRQWRLFTGSNGGYIGLHYVQGGYYRKSFPKHGPLTNPYAFGYFDFMTDKSSQAKLSQAMTFADAPGWPEEFRDQLLVARVLQQRIDLCEIKPEGSTYSAREVRPVVSTTDKNFRPVDLKLGPDGAVYIADWHEPNVTWNVTAEGTEVNKSSGRIYRVHSKGWTRGKTPDLARLSAAQLAERLGHPNQWQRETARRLLREKQDGALVPELAKRVETSTGQPAIEALWALHASGGFTEQFALRQLGHADPVIRQWTVRLLGDNLASTAAMERSFVEMAAGETDPQVRSQLACTAKRLGTANGLLVAEALARHGEDLKDPHLPLLVWWLVEDRLRADRAGTLLWLENQSVWKAPLFQSAVVSRLGQRFTTERSEENLRVCARLLAIAPGPAEKRELLRGMSRGLAGNKVDRIPAELEAGFQELWRREAPDAEMIEVAVRLGSQEATPLALEALGSESTREKDRATLLRLLAERGEPRAEEAVLQMLRHPTSAVLRNEALGAAQHFGSERIGRAILGQSRRFDAAWREKSLTILSSRKSWALLALREAESGRLEPKLVPRDVALALQKNAGPEGEPIIRKLWGGINPTSEEKRARIRQLSSVLAKGSGKAEAGKAHFDLTCARCHTLFGEGKKVGPDLTGIDRGGRDALLQSIVDPSASVLPEFMPFEITLAAKGGGEGQSVTGFIQEENANQITVMDAAGTVATIPKADIAARRALSVSIMPEGILESLSEQQVRDLFAYLQSNPAKK